MSRENVVIVRRVLAAFNSGGDEKLAEELVEPDASFEPLLAGVEGPTYRGPGGIMRWISEMNETFAQVHAEVSRIEEFDDVVLLTGKTTGRGRGAGSAGRGALGHREQVPAGQAEVREDLPDTFRGPRGRRPVR